MKEDIANMKQKMRDWLAHHRNWVINIIGVVACVGWIFIEYCLIKWGEIGEILVSLCQAYVASWLFYLVVVYIKERHDKMNVRPYIKRKVADLLYFHHKIVCKLAEEAGEDLKEKFPSRCRLEKYIQAISNENKAVKCFLRKKIGCIIKWHNLLYKVVSLLDSDLIRILTDIEDSDFAHGDVLNPNSVFKYQKHVVKLRKYAKKELGLTYCEALKMARKRDYG